MHRFTKPAILNWIRGFKSYFFRSEADAELQCGNSLMVELPSPKRLVRVRFLLSVLSGGFPERSKGADCKSAGVAFAGSNPASTTVEIL